MNLTYVRDFLETRKGTITREDVNCLISEINAYIGTENKFTDISSIMNTINSYNITFLTQVQEFEVIPKENIKLLPKRAEKVREILCTLSALHTYLVLSITNIKESTFNMKNIRTYMSELQERKEHFKSEKMTWATVLRSLSQEMSYTTEMRKMDIEDKVGYIKYKES